MLNLKICDFKEGQSHFAKTIMPNEIDLHDDGKFCKPIIIDFTINKVDNDLYLKTIISTTAEMECDRCLEPFEYELKESLRIVITSNAELAQDNEDDVYYSRQPGGEIDISESIRQSILVSLPVKKICHPKCKGLCSKCGENLNKVTCNCETETIDPRWEALKKLSNQK